MEQLTVENFRILVKAMKAVYSQPSFIADEDAFKTWFFMLNDIPYQYLQAGIQAHMQSEKFPPTIAEIRIASAKFMQREEEISDLEAWAVVRRAIGRSGYYWKEEFEKLPALVKKAVGRADNLKDWAGMDMETVDSVIQSQFLRSFRTIKAQDSDLKKLSPILRNRIENASETLTTAEQVNQITERKENEYHNSH